MQVTMYVIGYHCLEGNPVPEPCDVGHYCPNSDLSGYGPIPCPRLHYRDVVGAEQVSLIIIIIITLNIIIIVVVNYC